MNRMPTSKYDLWKTANPEDEPTEEEIMSAEEARSERLIDAREDLDPSDFDDAPYA
jgi:hypothetical protein